MFFFIGGVQPRTVTIDEAPRLCPSCGLAQARLQRVDHYVSLFFIPLFPIKRGEPVVVCNRCGAVSSPDLPGHMPEVSSPAVSRCPACGSTLEPSFNYCPRCGSRV